MGHSRRRRKRKGKRRGSRRDRGGDYVSLGARASEAARSSRKAVVRSAVEQVTRLVALADVKGETMLHLSFDQEWFRHVDHQERLLRAFERHWCVVSRVVHDMSADETFHVRLRWSSDTRRPPVLSYVIPFEDPPHVRAVKVCLPDMECEEEEEHVSDSDGTRALNLMKRQRERDAQRAVRGQQRRDKRREERRAREEDQVRMWRTATDVIAVNRAQEAAEAQVRAQHARDAHKRSAVARALLARMNGAQWARERERECHVEAQAALRVKQEVKDARERARVRAIEEAQRTAHERDRAAVEALRERSRARKEGVRTSEEASARKRHRKRHRKRSHRRSRVDDDDNDGNDDVDINDTLTDTQKAHEIDEVIPIDEHHEDNAHDDDQQQPQPQQLKIGDSTSSADDVQSSADDVQSSADGVKLSIDDVQSNVDDTQSSADDVKLSVDDVGVRVNDDVQSNVDAHVIDAHTNGVNDGTAKESQQRVLVLDLGSDSMKWKWSLESADEVPVMCVLNVSQRSVSASDRKASKLSMKGRGALAVRDVLRHNSSARNPMDVTGADWCDGSAAVAEVVKRIKSALKRSGFDHEHDSLCLLSALPVSHPGLADLVGNLLEHHALTVYMGFSPTFSFLSVAPSPFERNDHTGLVIEMGATSTAVVPVYCGHAMEHAMAIRHWGAHSAIRLLISMLSVRANKRWEDFASTRSAVRQWEEASQLLRKSCYVSTDFEVEMRTNGFRAKEGSWAPTVASGSPFVSRGEQEDEEEAGEWRRGANAYCLGIERFYVLQGAFTPSLGAPYCAAAEDQPPDAPHVVCDMGVHHMVAHVLQRVPRELREPMARNVVLGGNASLLQGMRDAVLLHVRSALDDDLCPGLALAPQHSAVEGALRWVSHASYASHALTYDECINGGLTPFQKCL